MDDLSGKELLDTGGLIPDVYSKPAAKAKKAAKPKAKKAAPKKKTGKPVKKAKVAAPAVVRSERLDLRLSKREKAMLRAKAVKLRRTLTSIFIEFVEKLK